MQSVHRSIVVSPRFKLLNPRSDRSAEENLQVLSRVTSDLSFMLQNHHLAIKTLPDGFPAFEITWRTMHSPVELVRNWCTMRCDTALVSRRMSLTPMEELHYMFIHVELSEQHWNDYETLMNQTS